jgi:hypothetical protein
LKALIIILFLIPLNAAFSQVTREWVQRFNGTDNRFDIANSLRLDALSNVYVYGSSSSTGTLTDITVVKYNSSGALLWSRLFDGYGNSVDQANGTFLDNSGNSYISGFTADTNTIIKIVTLKYNANGDLIWQNICLPPSYQQGIGYTICVDNNGNVYSAGNIRKQNATYDFILLKYSSNGSLIDSVIYDLGPLSSESATSVCIDSPGGNIYVMGSVEQPGLPTEILIVKFNSSLNPVWNKTLTGTAALADIPVQMILSSDNKLVICAGINNNSSGLDYGIFRLDTNSAVLMQYSFNGIGNNRDIPYAVTIDNSNNIYVTGSSRNADTLGSEDIVSLKVSQSGFLYWYKFYNGAGSGIDYGTSIAVDFSGNVYVGGAADKHDNHLAYALLKYNPAGDLQWFEEYSKIEFSEDFVYSVAVDNTYNVFVTGISFDSLSDYDIATIKYSQPIGITQISSEIPNSFLLYQNYPNPFNPVTNISFTVPSNVKGQMLNVKISIYDITGREVEILVNEELSTGIYEVTWDASFMPSGIYFYTLKAGNFSETKKMALIK